MEIIGAGGIASLAGCISGSGGSNNSGGGGGGGNSSGGGGGSGGSGSKKVGVTQHSVGGSWITAFFDAGKTYAENQGYQFESFLHNESAQEQITQIRQMTNQGFDGIVAVPYDESVSTAIEEADEAGIPVFAVNNTIKTDAIKTFTAFGNFNAGEKCGEAMIRELENQKGDQSAWDILNVRGEFFYQSNQRTKGFLETVKSHKKANVVDTIQTDWSQTNAQQKTLEWLNANEPPDGVYSSNMTSGLGVFSALQRQELVVPKGNKDHIVHTQLDAGPEVNPKIGDKLIDLAVDQPVQYYIPLAMKQMEDWWKNGDGSLPEVGSRLPADAYSFEPATYMQGATKTKLFKKPIWAPARVQKANKHINVQTAAITVDQQNWDAPYLWGNIWG